MAKVAVSVLPVPVSVPVPSGVAPSLKVTIPVGFEPFTVAVNVTLCPDPDGLALLARVVAVAAWLTTWLRVLELLAPLPASPA